MAAEFAHDDHILVQDGRTLEIFHRSSSESQRFHVEFLGVEVEPRGSEFRVRIGTRLGKDQIINGIRLKLNADQFARFREFIALATAARDQPAPRP